MSQPVHRQRACDTRSSCIQTKQNKIKKIGTLSHKSPGSVELSVRPPHVVNNARIRVLFILGGRPKPRQTWFSPNSRHSAGCSERNPSAFVGGAMWVSFIYISYTWCRRRSIFLWEPNSGWGVFSKGHQPTNKQTRRPRASCTWGDCFCRLAASCLSFPRALCGIRHLTPLR